MTVQTVLHNNHLNTYYVNYVEVLLLYNVFYGALSSKYLKLTIVARCSMEWGKFNFL